MSLTFHYNGTINKDASLSELIDEVKDIAEIYNWAYTIYEDKFPEDSFNNSLNDGKIYGISFTPPNSETVNICFLSNGRMSSFPNLKFWGESNDEQQKKYLYMLSAKTQFAGSTTHKLIVHLLKYLSKKYLNEFNVIDEGNYWETGDEVLLEQTFEKYNYFLNAVGDALEYTPLKDGEDFETYFLRIMKQINDRKNKK
jgi:hypothetical protein